MEKELLKALKAARAELLAAAEREGNDDYWNEGGQGYAVYAQVVKAINRGERYK
ncbi:hypothetical protein LCGC14_2494720 [marine sediment metagenome]|uniref:Uncharacterized protein n=1 Tax=marine sediment metagenome TaxID=412755 RepID=A0A0F9DXF1_9ZZZZ